MGWINMHERIRAMLRRQQEVEQLRAALRECDAALTARAERLRRCDQGLLRQRARLLDQAERLAFLGSTTKRIRNHS